jgi:hypothetical protein
MGRFWSALAATALGLLTLTLLRQAEVRLIDSKADVDHAANKSSGRGSHVRHN